MLQKLLMKCEKGVKDHQIYRDTFMAASDWLSSMVDNLNLCSDVRGDRTVVEAQLHKLQVRISDQKDQLTLSRRIIV